jgi:hypothetical protein
MANSIKGSSQKEIVNALRALGEIMLSQGEPTAVVAVGGTALILQNIVERTTRDIDIIAIGRHLGEGEPTEIESPDPFPEALVLAILKVARDFGLPDDWLNSTIGLQWKTGLPPGFTKRIHWQKFDALWFGVADRYDLIFLKLYAAADSEGPSSVHFQDLLALRPTEIELKEAAEWVRSQDTSPQFAEILEQVLDHAIRNL